MSILVLSHAILMSISIVLTLATTVTVIAKIATPKTLQYVNAAITLTGVSLGVYLLLSNPLDARCAVLFGYVLVFSVINRVATVQRRSLAAETV